ncbi:hypothetical protein HZS_2389 [Henneguya salminicola]|nr:hypothetical protein HZS_2389 [Henneguya salminicola]
MFRNYEDILPYIILLKRPENIKKNTTIIKNFTPKEYYFEMKFDYCPFKNNNIYILKKKLKENYNYSRMNGPWCRNPIRVNHKPPLFFPIFFINIDKN